MNDLTLRETVAADEDFLWQMLFYASHSYEEPGVEVGDVRANPDLVPYISGWRSGGMAGVVAETDVPVGAAWLRVMVDGDRSNPVYLDETTPELAIAVLPGLEGRGVGTALLSHLVSEAQSRFPGIVLSAREGNQAVRLYERHGFAVIGTMTNRVGTRSVRMAIRFDR